MIVPLATTKNTEDRELIGIFGELADYHCLCCL